MSADPHAWYVDCVCTRRPAGHPIPTSQCALCCTTGYIPWTSLNPQGQRAILQDGRHPWYWTRESVANSDLKAAMTP
jgi:hypothetical protein